MAGAIIKSLLKESIKNLPEQSIKAESVVPTLLKKGVKQEEIDFSGVTEGLPKSGKLTKQQLVDAEAARKDKFYVTEGDDHYKTVSLPGGQSNPTYREKVIKFSQADQLERDTGTQWIDGSETSRYTSSHFPEDKNYLAHTRVYDEDMGGQPTRVLQEMQSDLHQEGRQFGYKVADAPKVDLAQETQIRTHMADLMYDPEDLDAQDALVAMMKPFGYNSDVTDVTDFAATVLRESSKRVPKSPYEKTWLAKTIEREMVDAINDGRSQLAIPIKGAGVENLVRGEGVQKWYETQVLNTAKKIAKQSGSDFELKTLYNSPMDQIDGYSTNFDGLTEYVKNLDSRIDAGLTQQRLVEELASKHNLRGQKVEVFANAVYDQELEFATGMLDEILGDTSATFAVIKPKGRIADAEGSHKALGREYTEWTEKQGLPAISADEQVNVTPEQRAYLEDFITRWDSAEDIAPTTMKLDKPLEFKLYATPTASAFAAYTAYKAGYTDQDVEAKLLEQGYDAEEIAEINATAEKIADASAAGYSPEEIETFLSGKEIVPTTESNKPAPIDTTVETGTPTGDSFNALTDTSFDMEPKEFVEHLETYYPVAVSTVTSISAYFGTEEASQRLYAANNAAKSRAIKLAKDKFGIDLVRQTDQGTGNMEWFINSDEGLVLATPDSLDTYMTLGAEIALGIGGAVAGARTLAAITPPVLPVVGPLAKPIAGMLGAFGGGLLADASFQNINYLHSALKLQEDLESATLKHLNLSAVQNALIGEIAGYGLLKTVGVTGKVLKAVKNKVADGNIDGAYKALKDTTFLDESQLTEIVKTVEDFGVELTGKTEKHKAIQAYALTQPGGQDLVKATGSVEAQATKAVGHQVTRRAEDFLDTVGDLTDPSVAKTFQQDLMNYTMDVKANYADVKKMATQSPRGLNFTWDYEKLAIEPVLDSLMGKLGVGGTANVITEPTVQKFLTQANKIRSLADSRSFGDLIELRQLVNDFLYNKKIAKADSKGLLRQVLTNVDEAITYGARNVVDNPDKWLKDWAGARSQYNKMKGVEKTAIHRLMFDQKGKMRPVQPESVVKALGKYTTALDGSFEEVMSKLPVSGRNLYEGAVLKNATDKFTIVAEDGTKAINFPKLADELDNIQLTSPDGRALKKTVGKISEVFKNDAALFGISNSYNKLHVNQGLSADLASKAKYSMMAKVWDKMQTVTGFGRGAREVALVEQAATLLENPLNAVASKKLMDEFRQSPEMLKAITDMQQQAARALADGKDIGGAVVHLDANNKFVKGGKGSKTIPMHRIATKEQVKGIADASGVTVDSKSITQLLKNHGYVAVMQGSDRVKPLGAK